MKSKILMVLCALTGLMYLNAGLDKFFHYMPMPENMSDGMKNMMQAFMSIPWLMPLVGGAELVGGLLFAIPKTRVVGSLILLPIIAGILCVNITVAPSGLPIVGVLLAVQLWSMYEDRQHYLQLLK